MSLVAASSFSIQEKMFKYLFLSKQYTKRREAKACTINVKYYRIVLGSLHQLIHLLLLHLTLFRNTILNQETFGDNGFVLCSKWFFCFAELVFSG